MLSAVLTFLVGCLILAIILYVAKLVIDMLTLPANIAKLALIIIGLIGLIVLVMLTMSAFSGGGHSVIGMIPQNYALAA